MTLLESGEMYLETIYILSQQKPQVRSIDIVDYMNYSKPSVSRAMKNLKEAGYISMGTDNFISLTDKGLTIAQKIYERHRVLCALLEEIGVDKETAAEDACRIEHVISDKSFEIMKAHLKDEHPDLFK